MDERSRILNSIWKERLLFSFLLSLVVAKIIYAAFSSFSSDFMSWSSLGMAVVYGQRYFGVYTGSAYIYGAAYSFWLFLTSDGLALTRLAQLFNSGMTNVGGISQETFEFTLVMKIPLLIADVCTLLSVILITKTITHSRTKALSAGVLWASSPLVFLLEMSTTVEIFPALLILLGAFSIYRLRIGIGSALMALGIVLRLAPLLFVWIYIVAFIRSRSWKHLIRFLTVQMTLLLFAIIFIVSISSVGAIFRLLSDRPGILIPEVLASLGPFISAANPYNPPLGLGFSACLLVAYFITKPSVWMRRAVGAEALAFFAIYFAVTSFHIPFLLWMLPLFAVYAAVTGFGTRRYLLVTILGFLFYVFEAPEHVTQNGRAIFFVPNMNSTMAGVSAVLNGLSSVPLLAEVFRSLFAATLLLLVFWAVRNRLPEKESARTPQQEHLSDITPMTPS